MYIPDIGGQPFEVMEMRERTGITGRPLWLDVKRNHVKSVEKGRLQLDCGMISIPSPRGLYFIVKAIGSH